MKVLVAGLGLHGGGLASARYLLSKGADITVTDLRDEKTLAPSIERLEAACREIPGCPPVRYVLGRHETADFAEADFVIKNPGVRTDSPFLQAARHIETDISLFLAKSPARLTAVTGTKGKSITSSALHWVLKNADRKGKAFLGGNIAVSPLTFLDDLTEDDDVVLELSSWQLGDLKERRKKTGEPLLKPKAAIITCFMSDHQDYYGSMKKYAADKRVIYQGQNSDDFTVLKDDDWGRDFLSETKGRPLLFSEAPLPEGTSGGWLESQDAPGLVRLYGSVSPFLADGETAELVPDKPLVPGYHQKQNFLSAGLALLSLGLPVKTIWQGLKSFPGIEHRMEMFHTAGGIEFYNDSAATIPEAAAAAIEALGSNTVLVCGGTDKDLDFSPLVQAAQKAKAVILLAGTAGEKLRILLSETGIAFNGPFDSPEAAAAAAVEKAAAGDRVILSPGCASFGMFLNEFDRGRRWKEIIKKAAGVGH